MLEHLEKRKTMEFLDITDFLLLSRFLVKTCLSHKPKDHKNCVIATDDKQNCSLQKRNFLIHLTSYSSHMEGHSFHLILFLVTDYMCRKWDKDCRLFCSWAKIHQRALMFCWQYHNTFSPFVVLFPFWHLHTSYALRTLVTIKDTEDNKVDTWLK